jgi:deferrochelatase/peroxidase EfeB
MSPYLDSSSEPIDPDDSICQDFLNDLQGNILHGHGRDYAVHIFLHFLLGKVECITTCVSIFDPNKAISAMNRLDASGHFKRAKDDAGILPHFAITGSEYDYLGILKDKHPHGIHRRHRASIVPDGIGSPAPSYADNFLNGPKSSHSDSLDPPGKT